MAANFIQKQITGQYFYVFQLRSEFLNSYQVAEVRRNVWDDKIRPSISWYRHPHD